MKKNIFLVAVFVGMGLGLGPEPVWATELVYEPVNPAFGGNPLHGGWLLNSATSQNTYKEESDAANNQQSTIESFEQRLVNQILSRLSSTIVSATFGDDTLQPGEYDVGGFTISVTDVGDNVRVEIFNPETGDATIINVPYQQ